MSDPLAPIYPEHAPCKCCGARAALYGVVDFNKNCEIVRGREVLNVSGMPVYYYRCPACRFIFTTAFDHFSHTDFQQTIYNEDYARVDLDYLDARPRVTSSFVSALMSGTKPECVLDYGGGSGKLAELLRAAGFPRVESYDPFVSGYSDKPQRRYNCITCFEVAEHTTDPVKTFGEINELLEDPGVIVLSTLFQPPDIDQQRLNWWYAAPRNGHVSLYTGLSLFRVVERFGLQMASVGESLHLLFRELPDFVKANINMS